VAQAAAHPWTPDERAFAAERHSGQAIGSRETVRQALAELLERTGADELMLTTQVPDPAARLRSMQMVRELFPDALPPALDEAPAP
jgi:alkanesulfonate monooxygenase SsuD/methylene tetrahydromethanopterin reductase-like flavin-dependent oxidoreductase (luciferase family)